MANVKISELTEATSLAGTDLFEAVVSGSNRKVSVETLGETFVTAPAGSDTQIQRNNAGAFGSVSGATSDGTDITFGSGNLRATSPRLTTGIDDANGNELIKFTATASAVNEITIANAATGNSPTITATGGDTNIPVILSPKGSTGLKIGASSSSTTTFLDTNGGTSLDIRVNGSSKLNYNFSASNSWTLLDGLNITGNIVLDTTTGTKIGTATNQKLAFFNATPVVQQTGGAATATMVWTATEQAMLQTAYDALRTFGLLS